MIKCVTCRVYHRIASSQHERAKPKTTKVQSVLSLADHQISLKLLVPKSSRFPRATGHSLFDAAPCQCSRASAPVFPFQFAYLLQGRSTFPTRFARLAVFRPEKLV